MKRGAILVALTAVSIAAAVVVATASASGNVSYFWLSFEAEQAIENSDWGDARGVANVNCRGLGPFKKEYGSFKFARFRCELKNNSYDRIGFVTVRTIAPEAWKPENFIKPRCS